MVESMAATSRTLEQLEAEITCLVCQGHYKEAKLLPCMHYYCKTCIEELAAKFAYGHPFPCPECRKQTTLPSGSADELQSAFFVERMKDLYAKMPKAEGKAEAVCETCGEKATSFCRDCALFHCSACSTSHSESAKEHHVMLLERVESGPKDKTLECPEHGDQMTVFCFTCDCVACRDCIILSHSGHNFNILKKCALEKRREVCNSLVPLRKIQSDIGSADENLRETEKKIDQQGKSVHESIRDTFSQLRSLLDKREAELASKATGLVKKKKDTLALQRKELQDAQAEIQGLMEDVEQNLETSDQEMMSNCTKLHSRIVEEVKKHSKLSFDPTTTADIACDLPSLSIIPEKMGEVSCRASVVRTGTICDVHQPSSSILYTASKDITASLQSLSDPNLSVIPTITPKGSGVFEISFTAKVRGRHDLIVKVDGVNVDQSPFRILANIHPSRLRQPVRVIKDLNQPMGITLNSNKQLVVTECGSRKVTILNRDGTRLRSLESDDIKSPRGVADALDGTFYVACNVTTGSAYSCLLHVGYFGETRKIVTLESPFCIRMIRDALYVCVRGAVEVFDRDLNAIGSLKADGLNQPYDIAEGNNCLYVAGNAALGVIAKFSHNGNFEEYFQEGLLRPRCICVNSAGFVFVTLSSTSAQCVSVFNPSGDIVASFGMRDDNPWSGWGGLQNPVGITIDEDGFIYVCNTNCQEIVVF